MNDEEPPVLEGPLPQDIINAAIPTNTLRGRYWAYSKLADFFPDIDFTLMNNEDFNRHLLKFLLITRQIVSRI